MKQADQVQLYVVGPENKADLRNVKTGARMEGRVQIVEGVQAGRAVLAESLGTGQTRLAYRVQCHVLEISG